MKKGFTLLELLAVIVVLAIIALIVTPFVTNAINEARVGAFKNSAYGIISASELYYAENLAKNGGVFNKKTITYEDGITTSKDFEFKGDKPKKGIIVINEYGKVALAISNGSKCARKNFNETEVAIDDNLENCFIPITIEELVINETEITLLINETKEINIEIKPLSSTNQNLKITSKNERIVSVSEDRKITGVGVGTTTITIETTDGSNIKKEITTTVNPILANSIKLSTKNLTIEKGTSTTITAVLSPTNVTNKNINWKSNDAKVATVEGGLITGIGVGTTAITVTSGDGKISEEINVTVEERLLKSANNCINSSSACPSGTKVNVKVNDTEYYDFYVIKDTGTKLTMIMDRNLGGGVAYNESNVNNKGPITALNALKERTSGWTNIESYSYTLVDDADPIGGVSRYQPLSGIDGVTNVRARMLTYTEIASFGCKYRKVNESCPAWLYGNLTDIKSYWLSTSDSSSTAHVMTISYNKYLDHNAASGTDIGIRPVIEMSKEL